MSLTFNTPVTVNNNRVGGSAASAASAAVAAAAADSGASSAGIVDVPLLDGPAITENFVMSNTIETMTVKHPTDPLTADEIDAVNVALRSCNNQVLNAPSGTTVASLFTTVPPGWTPDNGDTFLDAEGVTYTQLLLREPIKQDVLNFNASPINDLKRYARAILNHPHTNVTYEAIVKLKNPPASLGVASGSSSIVVTKLNDVMYPNNNKEEAPMTDLFLYVFNPYISNADLIDYILHGTDTMASNVRARLTYRRVKLATDFTVSTPESGDNFPVQPYCYYSFESFRAITGYSMPVDQAMDAVDSNAVNHRFVPCCFLGAANNPKGIKIEGGEFSYVEGIFLIIDCNNKEHPVYRIVEDMSITPPAVGKPAIAPSLPDSFEPIPHETLKPIKTTMPDGVSFDVPSDDVHKVHWDNWDFRWSVQRSGLTLYNITYNDVKTGAEANAPKIVDNGVQVQLGADVKLEDGVYKAHAKQPGRIKRKIAYKHGSSDTGVVYNSTDPNVARSYVSYDSHNWPIMSRLQTLVPGRDVPGHAKLYSVVKTNAAGNSEIITGAVAIYEQENDLLWRVNNGVISAYNWPNGFINGQSPHDAHAKPGFTGCRKRQLVVRCIFSGFFYCFGFSYVFNLDGSMESYCDLFGQTTNQWIARGPSDSSYCSDRGTRTVNLPIDRNADELQESEYRGELIAKQYVGLTHTHFSMFRTDFSVDGENNAVDEINVYRLPMNATSAVGSNRKINGSGQVVKVEEKQLMNETASSLDFSKNRTWRVYNKNRRNRLGHTRGYEYLALNPNGNSTSLSNDDSLAHKKFSFLKNHFHVTKYRPDEEYGAGEFPVLNNKVLGMTNYLTNESVDDKDLVCWYNCMFQHHPDTEDYPFISGHRLGMGLYPSHFFGMNPACSLEQNTTLEADGTGESGFPGNNGLAEIPANGDASMPNAGVSGYEKVNVLRVPVYPPFGINDTSVTGYVN
jgi:primary-amine oxidase